MKKHQFNLTIVLFLFCLFSCSTEDKKAIEMVKNCQCAFLSDRFATYGDIISLNAGIAGHIEYKVENYNQDVKTVHVNIETINDKKIPQTINVSFLVNLNTGQVHALVDKFRINNKPFNPFAFAYALHDEFPISDEDISKAVKSMTNETTKDEINEDSKTIKKLSYTEIKEIFNNTHLSEIITSSDYFTDYDLENTTAISFVKQKHPDNKIQCKVSGENESKNVVNLTFEILNKETDQIEASMKFTYDRSTEKFEFIGEFKEK